MSSCEIGGTPDGQVDGGSIVEYRNDRISSPSLCHGAPLQPTDSNSGSDFIRHEPESRLGSTGLMDGAQVLPRPAAIQQRSTVLTGGAQVAPRPAATRQRSTALMVGGLAPQRPQANAKVKTLNLRDGLPPTPHCPGSAKQMFGEDQQIPLGEEKRLRGGTTARRCPGQAFAVLGKPH